jgi:polyvinyl alcohol dehydrogenase (cytochrome)
MITRERASTVKITGSAAAAAAVLILLAVAPAAGQTFVNWPQYLFSAQHTSQNSSATVITTANAAQVSLAWKFAPPTAPSGLGGFFSSPTAYNGVIYIGARNGYFYAINETTGAVIWSRLIGYVTKTTCGAQGFTSTATVAADPTSGKPTVYVYGASGYLYAMDAATGADVWPPAVVAIPSTSVNDYYAWGSPLVAGGHIYVGISSECDIPLVRGGLDSFSQATGKLLGTFWTAPAGSKGASIWSSPASDGASVYITTGNGLSGGLGFSIIKLSPSLAEQGIWTVPVADRVTDSDFGASPAIWSATLNGTVTSLAGACNKNGTFYALRPSNLAAGPVWLRKIGNPYPQGPGQCDAAAVFDGSRLYLASDGTTIHGTAYQGSVRQVDPASGAIIWQTGLTGPIIGTPGMDGAGVIAAASFGSTTGQNGVFLINAATGKILKTISYGASNTFGQPVFADSYLLVASTSQALKAYKAP